MVGEEHEEALGPRGLTPWVGMCADHILLSAATDDVAGPRVRGGHRGPNVLPKTVSMAFGVI